MAKGREGGSTIGWLALFGMAWIGIAANTYLQDDGALPPLSDQELSFDLPDNCDADRTASGYTVTCHEIPGHEAGSGHSASRVATNEQ